MQKNAPNAFIDRREAYELWFDFLALAMAQDDEYEPEVAKALKASRKFYEPWHMNEYATFEEEWWERHAHLFEEQHAVRRLKAKQGPSSKEDSLVIEVPLNKAPTALLKDIKAVLEEAWREKRKAGGKNQKVSTARYRLTPGRELKLDALRSMQRVLSVRTFEGYLTGMELLEAVVYEYKSLRMKLPKTLIYDEKNPDDVARALRNLRRQVSKGRKIMLNVARGEFPGQYE